ncbi:Dabb family protein [Pontibacter brevis]
MKKITGLSLAVALFATIAFLSGFQGSKKEPVRHIVVFKYKPDAAPAKIEQVTQAFANLKSKIPGITAYEHGINNSPENKNLGFTHVYQLTFEDAAARDAYLPHPEHKKFGALLGQLDVLEDAFVVDYVPAKAKVK